MHIDRDPVTKSPKFIGSTDGFLSGPDGSGRAVSNDFLKALPASDRHRTVKAFLNEHQSLLGYGAEVLDGARVDRDETGKHNAMRSVVWQQTLDSIPVFEGIIKVHVTRNGELVNFGSQFVTEAASAADKGMSNRRALQRSPTVTLAQAVATAASKIETPVQVSEITALDEATGSDKMQHFTHAKLIDPCAHLVWFPLDSTTLRLCWDVVLMSNARREMYRVLVDAETGAVMLQRSLTCDLTDASYRVFTSDSPSPFSPGWTTPNSGQPPLIAQTLVTTPALNTTASPGGWIDDDVNETRGNNVDAHLDLNYDNQPDLPRPQGSPNRIFDFPLDPTQSPSAAGNRNAAVVQLFYWCNWAHDKFYELGFTEAAGNFQNNNFGRGGVGNDAVQADTQDGSGTNNANFSTPPDGSPGRMQMYIYTGPYPQRDACFDAEVVLHEATHGLSNRLVGGGIGISALQTKGLGEGWSDFYALSLLSEASDNVNGNYAVSACGPPTLADISGNGAIELVYTATKTMIRDLPTHLNPAKVPWPMMGHDTLATNRYSPPVIFSTVTPSIIDPNVPVQVVITGNNFLKAMKVSIGGVPQAVIAESATTITVNVRATSNTGAKDIALSNVNTGSLTAPNALLVSNPLVLTVPLGAVEGAGVLRGQGHVSTASSLATDLAVMLISSDTSEVAVPQIVVLHAGQTDEAFDVTIVDDSELGGPQTATITASAQGTVSASVAPAKDIVVALQSSDTTATHVPTSITIPAGQMSVSFSITIVDDNKIDGTQSSTSRAHVANWTDASASINVTDNENTNLVLSLPLTAREGDALKTGTVQIGGTISTDLAVSIVSSDTTEVTVPATVTIPAGQTFATFGTNIIDDTEADGTQPATITASAPGFVNARGQISVADNDAHHFVIAPVASSQIYGVPVALTITAQDSNNDTILEYTGSPSLTASGSSGSLAITPTTAGGFVKGVWAGNVSVSAFDTNVVIKVDDCAGHVGTTNPFNVGAGPVDHFAWSTVVSPQLVDNPFNVTITAQGAGNNTVQDFSGTVDLSVTSNTRRWRATQRPVGKAAAGRRFTSPMKPSAQPAG